jgi:hypothetical protein
MPYLDGDVWICILKIHFRLKVKEKVVSEAIPMEHETALTRMRIEARKSPHKKRRSKEVRSRGDSIIHLSSGDRIIHLGCVW